MHYVYFHRVPWLTASLLVLHQPFSNKGFHSSSASAALSMGIVWNEGTVLSYPAFKTVAIAVSTKTPDRLAIAVGH